MMMEDEIVALLENIGSALIETERNSVTIREHLQQKFRNDIKLVNERKESLFGKTFDLSIFSLEKEQTHQELLLLLTNASSYVSGWTIFTPNADEVLGEIWKYLLEYSWMIWKRMLIAFSNNLINDEQLKEEGVRKEQIINVYEGLTLILLTSMLLKNCLLLIQRALGTQSSTIIPQAIKDSRKMASFLTSQLLLKSLLESYTIKEWSILTFLSHHEIQLLLQENRYPQELSSFLRDQNQRIPSFFYFATLQEEEFTRRQFSSQHSFSSLAPISLIDLEKESRIIQLLYNSISGSFHLWKEWMEWINGSSTPPQKKTNDPKLSYQDMITYIHIELAKGWNQLPSHFYQDQLFFKAYHCSFTIFSAFPAIFGDIDSQRSTEVQSSGMVGIIALIMRLFERHDQRSHLLAVHLLHQSLERMTSNQALPFVEWIVEKVFVMFNVIDHPVTKFYLHRVFQSMVLLHLQSNLLLKHAYLHLDQSIKSICRDYSVPTLWYQVVSLQFMIVLYPSTIIQAYLTKLITLFCHVMNRWHLPLQRLILLQINYLVDTVPSELMQPFLPTILNELFRNFLFYSKDVTPDLSIATIEEKQQWLTRLQMFRSRLEERFPYPTQQWKERFALLHPSQSNLHEEKHQDNDDLITPITGNKDEEEEVQNRSSSPHQEKAKENEKEKKKEELLHFYLQFIL